MPSTYLRTHYPNHPSLRESAGTHAIGETVWFRGDPITITTGPYMRHGGEWQDGTTESGHVVTVPTPRWKAAR